MWPPPSIPYDLATASPPPQARRYPLLDRRVRVQRQALAASLKQVDIIGSVQPASPASAAAFRDLILGLPVFWVANPAYVLVCSSIAVLVFFTAHLVESVTSC